MNTVVNTSEKEREISWLMGGSPSSIEAQERRGRDQLVNSDVLPSKMEPSARAELERQGVLFSEPVDGDTLFVNVTLPAGWKKVATDHAMWSDLVDAWGKTVAVIFYKAAFYDRSAFLRLEAS